MKPTFAQLEKGMVLNFTKISKKLLNEITQYNYIIESFYSVEDFVSNVGKEIIILNKDSNFRKIDFEIEGRQHVMFWQHLRQIIEAKEDTILKDTSRTVSDIVVKDGKFLYKVNGVDGEMFLELFEDNIPVFSRNIVFKFKFKTEDKKKMTTKVINVLKQDSKFKEFVMNKINENLENYIPTNITGNIQRWHSDLNVYLMGNSLTFDNHIYTAELKEKVSYDFEMLVDKFLARKACQTNMNKVETLFIQRS